MYVPVYISDHLPQIIVSDGVLVEQGFRVRKEKGKVQIQLPGCIHPWRDLHLDSDGRAYLGEELVTRPVPAKVKNMILGMASRELWYARLGHRAYSYLDAMRRFPQYAEAGFRVDGEGLTIARSVYCQSRRETIIILHVREPRNQADSGTQT